MTMNLADLVADLPARVHQGTATTREAREAIVNDPYSNNVHQQWLRDLDKEAATRATILPFERPPRKLDEDAIREGALADLVIEKHRRSHAGTANIGPAPASREGLRDTLRSFINAQEPCDRYDALIRHAAVALMLAEEISAGRA
jgi:hypothetical protein